MAEIIIVDSRAAGGEVVATAILELIARKPDAVLGLATGSTPLPVYRALAAGIRDSKANVSAVRGFALDEYVGLPSGHPESYREVIARDVVAPLGLHPELVQVPDGAVDGIETAGERYEAAITAAGGIDLQILGVGTDGHIGFNEPGSSLASLTRVKTLAEQTRRDNSRFFDSIDDVPVHCITQGLGTILRARHLVVLAFGASKAAAVARAVEGPVAAMTPASAIQLHPHVSVIVDSAAAAELENADYYRYVRDHAPAWQPL